MSVNISRHTGTFSDFSWPKHTHDFPTTQEVYKYLCNYAKHYNLMPYIQFGCRIVQVIPQDKKWIVRWQENQDSYKEEIFDSVIIATSKFTHPHIPGFQGLDKFNGKILHSSKYRSVDEFTNKKVFIVGGSLSGTSIAEELAKETSVIHLLRKERWIVKRYRSSDPENNGPLLPRDLLKSYATAQKVLSNEEQYQFMLQHCSEQNEFPEWCMHPHSPIGFVVADDYLNLVRSGKLIPMRGEIKYFTESGIVLQNGDGIDFDAVIFCTGYQRELSFLPEHLRLSSPLYEDTFPPGVEGIAFIGMYPGARGAAFPLLELQAELACSVFSGRYQLPSAEIMLQEIAKTPKDRDEVQFSSALAKKLGVLPDLNSFNPSLRHVLINGAYTPARFCLIDNPTMALKMIEETEAYRRNLMRSKDRIPSLASLCFFQIQHLKKDETDLELITNFGFGAKNF